MSGMSGTIDRAAFLKGIASLFAIGLIDTPALRRMPMVMAMRELHHPDPRPDITADHVLVEKELGKLAGKKNVMAAYDNARAYPEIFDGLACGCGCTAEGAGHRSLLSCYESMQPSGCPSCREESVLVAKLAQDKKTLAEIRVAVNKEFG